MKKIRFTHAADRKTKKMSSKSFISAETGSGRTGLSLAAPQRKAFTLAEVLITLVIIGVIGALTVPSLIQNTRKQEYVSALQKAYSTLSQASNMIISEEGSPKCSDGGWACSAEDIYSMYKKYLINAKECGKDSGCMYTGMYKRLNGNNFFELDADSSIQKLVFADGMQAYFQFWSEDCSYNDESGEKDVCGGINVDINGAKSPNQFGRDIFTFMIKENGLLPRGCSNPSYDSCNPNGDNIFAYTGYGCACKVLTEKAMNY